MLKNYFNIAWRNLRKTRLYSFVNIIGLTIGITSCILIALYIETEWSFDRFHKNADRIVRVTMEYSNGGTVGQFATTGTKVGPQFRRSFPAVTAFARTFKYPRVVRYGDKVFDEKNFLYADSSFFSIFSFKLFKGNLTSVLSVPHQLVITESMARKYFGAEDPVGKTLLVANSDYFTGNRCSSGCTRKFADAFRFYCLLYQSRRIKIGGLVDGQRHHLSFVKPSGSDSPAQGTDCYLYEDSGCAQGSKGGGKRLPLLPPGTVDKSTSLFFLRRLRTQREHYLYLYSGSDCPADSIHRLRELYQSRYGTVCRQKRRDQRPQSIGSPPLGTYSCSIWVNQPC